MASFTTEAVILRAREFGEADRLLTLYTLAAGKITAKVRGARKPRSRLAGATLPLTHAEVQLWQGRSNILTLTQAVSRDAYAPLREDLRRLALANFAAEMVDLLTEDGAPSSPTYIALLETMALIAYGEAPDLAAYSLALRMLRAAGLLAPLVRCAACGRSLEQGMGEAGAGEAAGAWSPTRGAFVCGACAGEDDLVSTVRQGTVATLGVLLDGSPRALRALRVDDAARKQLRMVLWDAINVHLDRRPRSMDFLDSLSSP